MITPLEAFPPDPKRPSKVVHFVHGTWQFGLLAHRLRFLRKRPLWFESGSSIRDDIESRVPLGTRFETFEWSGDNSFVARDDAATQFVAHLRHAIDAFPRANHLIVAHSHGGTVAVEALRKDPKLTQSGVTGMMSIATPFVSLHRQSGSNWEGAFMLVIARFVPYLIFLIALTAWAAQDHSPELTYTATFMRLMTMGGFLLIVLHTSGLLPWFPMPGRKLANQLMNQPLPPLDPGFHLFALRAPRDEASLAIATAQVVGALSDFVWRVLIHAPVALIRRAPVTIVLLLLGLYSLFVWLGLRETAQMQGFERVFAVAIYASFLMLAAYTVPVLVAFLVLLPASFALALAVGVETMALPGLLTVDAEPLPAGGTARELLILDLSEEDRERLPMRHSIYQLSSAREQVATWINQN